MPASKRGLSAVNDFMFSLFSSSTESFEKISSIFDNFSSGTGFEKKADFILLSASTESVQQSVKLLLMIAKNSKWGFLIDNWWLPKVSVASDGFLGIIYLRFSCWLTAELISYAASSCIDDPISLLSECRWINTEEITSMHFWWLSCTSLSDSANQRPKRCNNRRKQSSKRSLTRLIQKLNKKSFSFNLQ